MIFKKILDVQELQKNNDFSCGYPSYPFKKNIVIYSNCHGLVISELLRYHEYIHEHYNVFLILGYLYDKKEEYNVETIPLNTIYSFVKTCDVFIYQSCYHYNEDLSSETMLDLCKPDCKKIHLTNPQNTALWSNHFPEKDRNIYTLHEEYISTMLQFKNNDSKTDTPVYKYVVENLKKYRLFIDRPHPTLRLFVEIVKYIWNILDVNVIEFDDATLEDNPNPCCLPGSLEKNDLDSFLNFSI